MDWRPFAETGSHLGNTSSLHCPQQPTHPFCSRPATFTDPHVSTHISDPRRISRFALVLKSEQSCLQTAVSNSCNMSHWNYFHIQFIRCVQHFKLPQRWNWRFRTSGTSAVSLDLFPDVSTKHGAFTFRTASILKPLFLWAVKYIPAANDVALPDHKR